MSRCKRMDGKRARSLCNTQQGFTLIELLSVIAFIAIIAAMLMPTFARAREMARRTLCLSNLKQIGMAVDIYAQDYDEFYVPAHGRASAPIPNAPAQCLQTQSYRAWWGDLLQPYINNTQIFLCSSLHEPTPVLAPRKL